MGSLGLLQAAKNFWSNQFENKLFYHVSTDEVCVSLGAEGYFTEQSNYAHIHPIRLQKHLQIIL